MVETHTWWAALVGHLTNKNKGQQLKGEVELVCVYVCVC